ncbi:MAG TPA: DUF1553 domain-containing protein [Chthonomonadaceae bacterium]|nr:DUF1553 domain-containing protein [Chthonomonadaceae bacterium]
MQKVRRESVGIVLGGALLCALAGFAGGQNKPAQPETVSSQAAEFFESKVRPLLFDKCFSCHGEKIQQGGLRLDSRDAMLKGGGSGPAMVAGEPEKSRLITAVHYDTALKMPPGGKLKADEIATLTGWVKMGAPWPGAKPAAKAPTEESAIAEAQRTFWSFKPVKKAAPPTVKNKAWGKSPIDAFILAKLEAKGLQPAPPADRRTLIRRAYFDLIGMPPTPEEVDAFIADKSPIAFATVVDKLLADPRYGERWGRHWLDVARYADTKGYVFTEDAVYHNGYTYRDYVIRAFNEDLPYDQFIIQQLAADRLSLGDDKRPLAALGFLNIGRRFLNDPVLINDDRIDVTMRGMQGLTVACARCHNHKFDPIPSKDYYSLYGVFASAVESNPPVPISAKNISEPYEAHNSKVLALEKEGTELIQGQITHMRGMVEKDPNVLSTEVRAVLQSLRIGQQPDEGQMKKLMPAFEPAAQTRLKALQGNLTELKQHVPPTPEFALASQDTPTPFDPYVFLRGNPGNHGESVPRRFLAVLTTGERKPFPNGGGRLDLAQAIANKDNPLTARVFVNRVWLYHFGNGIVRTPSDFGFRGEPPTHPELLDWLAATFMEENWSIKKLQRTILLSSTYQMSSDVNPHAFALDPENRLLAHQNRQRLDLESLRDSVLYVAGRLDTKLGGPSVELTTAPFSTRRTVYGFIDRQNLQGMYRTFDLASPDTSSAQRFRTTVPQQSLFMMNSPFVVEQARALAKRPEIASQTDETARIRALYRLLFDRTPEPDEITFARHFLRGVEEVHPANAQATSKLLTPWEEYVQTLLMTNEFAFAD